MSILYSHNFFYFACCFHPLFKVFTLLLLDQANGTAKISILCLGVNLILSLILVFRFKQAGLGAANSLTSFLNMVLLAMALRRKLSKLTYAPLLKTGHNLL